MEKDLIIDHTPDQTTIVILEDGAMTELSRVSYSFTHGVDDVYIGRVKKVADGLNAAFVDVGASTDGFLHYRDLDEHFLAQKQVIDQLLAGAVVPEDIVAAYKKARAEYPDVLPKEGKISDCLKAGDWIVVQVTKEAISTKGPRLTTDISISGRNLVFKPFEQKHSVSSKLSGQEGKRLRFLVNTLGFKGHGVIVRTAAEGKEAQELDEEFSALSQQWRRALSCVAASRKEPKKRVQCLYEAPGRALAILRDTFDKSFRNVWVNDEGCYSEIESYINKIDPEGEGGVRLHLYKDKKPLLDYLGVTAQIKRSFGRTVNLPGGAYLVIEKTEAMHVIDINSGRQARKNEDTESTAVDVNMSAAVEVARQIRLRDLGGIIMVDFIDMKDATHRSELYKRMEELMAGDKAEHEVYKLTGLGLMQISRKRVRPEVKIREDRCPTCLGTGRISDKTISLIEDIERALPRFLDTFQSRYIDVHVHPFVEAYLKKGWFSIATRWKFKISRGIHIVPNQSLSLLDCKYYDKAGQEYVLEGK